MLCAVERRETTLLSNASFLAAIYIDLRCQVLRCANVLCVRFLICIYSIVKPALCNLYSFFVVLSAYGHAFTRFK